MAMNRDILKVTKFVYGRVTGKQNLDDGWVEDQYNKLSDDQKQKLQELSEALGDQPLALIPHDTMLNSEVNSIAGSIEKPEGDPKTASYQSGQVIEQGVPLHNNLSLDSNISPGTDLGYPPPVRGMGGRLITTTVIAGSQAPSEDKMIEIGQPGGFQKDPNRTALDARINNEMEETTGRTNADRAAIGMAQHTAMPANTIKSPTSVDGGSDTVGVKHVDSPTPQQSEVTQDSNMSPGTAVDEKSQKAQESTV